MTDPFALPDAVARLRLHLDALSRRFVGRHALLELVVLGLVAREHLLLIGPPGTGKSAAVQAIARSVDARSFEYLIGRFTEPSELFGALDLQALRDGEVRPVTRGMLPEAQIAFLDEIFLGSTAILNSLLKILNERTYRRGQFETAVPLISCVAASNALPDDPALAAFADRFLLTGFVDPVGEGELVELLRVGWRETATAAEPVAPLSVTMLESLHHAALAIDLSPVWEAFAHLVRKVRLVGVALSDRKLVKAQKLIAAAAVLRGVEAAGPEDLWPLTFLVQSRPQQEEVRELLAAELRDSSNPVLPRSVAAAPHGPTAHAAALAENAAALLAAGPAAADDPAREIWLVRLETILTRIDAAFAPGKAPSALQTLRATIEATLNGEAQPA